jgi:hypothetical protein
MSHNGIHRSRFAVNTSGLIIVLLAQNVAVLLLCLLLVVTR